MGNKLRSPGITKKTFILFTNGILFAAIYHTQLNIALLLKMVKKILVTEDDPSLQEIFKIILENAGYEVEVKASGNAIMENAYIKPDLFLLDKQLSGMDGIDICIHLKKQEETRDIPVVMVSANPGIAQMSQEAGANAFVEKPFERSHLLKVIKDCIEQQP